MSQETEMQPYREGLDELAGHYHEILTLLGEGNMAQEKKS